MQEMHVGSLDQEDHLEKEMTTHSSILAWEIPWTEVPGGLQFLTQGLNPGLLHCMQTLYQLSYQGSPITESEIAQSRPTLCNTVDCNLPGSSVNGIFQARMLEWIVISFSR